MSDLISRQDALDEIRRFSGYLDEDMIKRIRIGLNRLPSAYTGDELQKMQELEQAQLDKAYELGRQSAQPEIVRCKDCKFGNISSMGHLAVCGHEKGLVDPVPDSYCSYAERRTDERT